MAGRDHGKGKGGVNRKDAGGKKFGQQFCKLFLGAESREQLEKKNISPLSLDRRISVVRIPSSFSQYLPDHPTGLVCLKGQSGNTWLAELASDSEGLFFGYGWKKFVVDHCIETGHILTFCYVGRSQFSVVIFDGMCVEKLSAFDAKPSNDLVGTTESDLEDKEMSVVRQEETNGTKRKTGEINANGSTVRKHSNGASVGYKSASLSTTEDSGSPYSVSEESISHNESSKSVSRLLKFSINVDIRGKKESIPRNKSSKSVPTLLKFSKDVDISGKTIVEVQRQAEVKSQRPPVSEEQKNYALERAKEYKSKYPITVQVMKETFVYNTFFMMIPRKFVREYLPRADKKFTLVDPLGQAWEVTYVYYSKRRTGAFSGGWGKFSVGNHLETSDVCVFKLFSEDTIKVHIYRASPTLYPYLLESEGSNQ